jgi:hypothetical protein
LTAGAVPGGGAPGVGFLSGDVGGEDGLARRSINAGLA